MAGYVIHSIIGEQYLLKNKKNNENYEDFIRGNYLPDLTNDKKLTHYGKTPAYTNLKNFLLNNELDTSLKRGMFLHLIADYLFYNKYLGKVEKEVLHNDYDLTNKYLIDKYNLKLRDEIKDFTFLKEGTPKVLTIKLVEKFIEDVSSFNLEKVKAEALADNPKWNTYRNN